MVDDSKYVIVPNKTDSNFKAGATEPTKAANENGRHVAELIIAGYRIISKQSNRDAVHYVLLKFKPGFKPTQVVAEE